MKIIDFHTHVFPDKIAEKTITKLAVVCNETPYTNGMESGLRASTAEAGISTSIVLPVVTAPSQFESIHRFALRFLEGELLSFGGIHPEDEHYKERLRWIKSEGFKGIKLHPDYQGVYFNDIRYKRIVSCATELDLIVSVHAGLDPLCPNDIHCTPQMSLEVIKEVAPTKLVLAHMGANALYDEVEHYLIGQDVYLDTSYVLDKMEKEQFYRMIKNHGEDKVLFATDSPWGGQKEFVDYFMNLELPQITQEQILYKNAERLINE